MTDRPKPVDLEQFEAVFQQTIITYPQFADLIADLRQTREDNARLRAFVLRYVVNYENFDNGLTYVSPEQLYDEARALLREMEGNDDAG